MSGATDQITLAITMGTGADGASLSGTLSRPAVAGAATFGDVSVNTPGTGYTLTATATGVADAVSAPFGIRVNPAAWLAGRWVLTDTVATNYGYYVSPSGPGPLLFQAWDTRTVTLAATRLGADSLAVTGTVTAKEEVQCSDPLYSHVSQGEPTAYSDTLTVTSDSLYGLLPDPTYALPLPPAPADTLTWRADSGPVCAAARAATSSPDRLLFSCTHRIHMVRQ